MSRKKSPRAKILCMDDLGAFTMDENEFLFFVAIRDRLNGDPRSAALYAQHEAATDEDTKGLIADEMEAHIGKIRREVIAQHPDLQWESPIADDCP